MEVNDEKDLLIYALVKKLQQASFSQVRLLHHIAGCVCSHQFTDDLGKRKENYMPYYRTCPLCGAALDPDERCDCQDKEEAAPVLEHRDGQRVKVIDQTTFTSNFNKRLGGNQE